MVEIDPIGLIAVDVLTKWDLLSEKKYPWNILDIFQKIKCVLLMRIKMFNIGIRGKLCLQ